MTKNIADTLLEFGFHHYDFSKISGGEEAGLGDVKSPALGVSGAADLSVVQQNHNRSADMNIFDK